MTGKELNMYCCGVASDAAKIRQHPHKLDSFHKQAIREAIADLQAALTMSRPQDKTQAPRGDDEYIA